MGGSHLHEATAGAPEERLFIVYDRYNSEPLEKLVNLLQTHIDLPARQIVIEALVIEANTNHLRDLGVEFSSSKSYDFFLTVSKLKCLFGEKFLFKRSSPDFPV